jgi:MinD-like ATPase involved in chromosome partitioning or flagellar assembly
VRTNILLALTDQTWQLQVMTALNDNSQIKIRRRCVDSVDLMSAIHLGLANKVVISAGFENLNSTTISGAKKLGCDVYGIYLENDIDSLEKLVGVGVKSNFAIDETDVEKSLKGLINLLLNVSEIDKFSNELEDLSQVPGLVCVWGTNGSPGRSSVAINLSFSLASKNSPTLLVDLDAIVPSLAPALGLVSEVPGVSSLVHDALKGRLSQESIEKNVIEVNPGLHVLTGISNPKRWPELRTEGLIQVLKLCSQMYANIICDLSAVLPESTDSSLNDVDIFRRFDHIPKVLEISSRNIFVLSATPLSLIRASEALEALHEINKSEPLIILNKVNEINLGQKYESTVEAILGRWVNSGSIYRIPDRPEIFAESWMRAESVQDLGDKQLNEIFDEISKEVKNEISRPPKYRRFLRKVS